MDSSIAALENVMTARLVPLPSVHDVPQATRNVYNRTASAAVRVMRREPGWDPLAMLTAALDVGERIAREKQAA